MSERHTFPDPSSMARRHALQVQREREAKMVRAIIWTSQTSN